jgi:hypothetical protein
MSQDKQEELYELLKDMRDALVKMDLWPMLSVILIDSGPPDQYLVFAGRKAQAIARVYCAEVERIEHLPDEGSRTNACRCFKEDGFRVYPCDSNGKIDPEDGAQLSMDVLDSRTALSACLGMLVNYAYDM